jgi:hypothetical protein
MNDFRIFAHGPEFNPDAYVVTSRLTFDGVWRKGETGHDHPKSSGLFKVLGDGQALPLSEQQRIAIEYLSSNQNALKELARHPEVTTFILGLQYHIGLDDCTIGFCLGPSELLMRQCLDIGISPLFYVSLDRQRDWDEQDV